MSDQDPFALESLLPKGCTLIPKSVNDVEPGYNPYGTHLPVVRYYLDDRNVLHVEQVVFQPNKTESQARAMPLKSVATNPVPPTNTQMIKAEFSSPHLPITITIAYDDILILENQKAIVCITDLNSIAALNKISLKNNLAMDMVMTVPTFSKSFKLNSAKIVVFQYKDLEFCVMEYTDCLDLGGPKDAL